MTFYRVNCETSYSHFQYAQPAYAGQLTVSDINSDSITPVLMRLHWLPIQLRITYKVALLTYKDLQTGQPEYLESLLQWHESTRVLEVPECVWTSFASHTFSCAASEICNSLPPDFIDAFISNSIAYFKSHLKMHLYRQLFSK